MAAATTWAHRLLANWPPGPAAAISLERLAQLRRFNVLVALAHFGSALLLFPMSDRDATVPVYTMFANAHHDKATYGPELRKIADPIVGYIVGSFLLLAGTAQLLNATLFRCAVRPGSSPLCPA